MHMHDPLPPAGSRNVYEERFEAQRSRGGLMGGARDAAQSVLENVIRQLRAGGLPGIGGGGGGAGGEGAPGLEGADHARGLQEEQLRQITEAVQMLRARHQAHAQDGALPGAFPDDLTPLAVTADGAAAEAATGGAGQDGAAEQGGVGLLDAEGDDRLNAESAGNASMFQSLSDMMRLLGFGPRNAAGDDAAAGAAARGGGVAVDGLPLTQEETDELVAAMVMNNLAQGGFGDEEGEEGEDEDYSGDEDQPFGPDGDDGWEPYDPAAYQ